MRMNMIATTQEQSQRLLRCGVSADTADMCYDSGALSLMDYDSAEHERDSRRESYEVIPAWSLSALLSKVLPHNISVDKYKYKGATEYEVGGYFTGHRDKIAFNATNPIEACVKAIEWLTANGYKLHDPDCPCREKGGENE